ncbi:MAG: multifunctional CCA addition/repair protein [Hydrogenophilus sp.]
MVPPLPEPSGSVRNDAEANAAPAALPPPSPSRETLRARLQLAPPDPLVAGLDVYLVGGAVRDALLGLPVHDRDWVVVGATPEALAARGFRPVGKDFPVFLHPKTGEEYALARTERKSGRGYKGFTCHAAPDVTLEADLARRDLTINAIAVAPDGTLIDPYGGAADLEHQILRHVSPAFVEDPLRVLRVARFAARFTAFTVAPETRELIAAIAQSGELAALTPERVWQEFARGLMEAAPQRMIALLQETGALKALIPELAALFGVPQPERYHPEGDVGTHTLLALGNSARQGLPLAVRWAVLLHDLGKGATPAEILPHHYGHEARGACLAETVSRRLKAPNDCRALAVLVAREHGLIHQGRRLRPATRLKVLERCDALRRPARFAQLLAACECDATARPPLVVDYAPVRTLWEQALTAARAIPTAKIAQSAAGDPRRIAERIRAARIAAIAASAKTLLPPDDAPNANRPPVPQSHPQ